MNNRLKSARMGTKRVLTSRWSPHDLKLPAWVVRAFIYITIIRSFSYGAELLLTANEPLSSLMAFAGILGLQFWGIVMLIGVGLIVLGLLIRNSITVTLGALVNFAVWAGFGVVLTIGCFTLGTGGRFAVAALSTAATWLIFFIIQLKMIKGSEVEV